MKVGDKVITVGDVFGTEGTPVDAGVEGVITNIDQDGDLVVTFEHNVFRGIDRGVDFWFFKNVENNSLELLADDEGVER